MYVLCLPHQLRCDIFDTTNIPYKSSGVCCTITKKTSCTCKVVSRIMNNLECMMILMIPTVAELNACRNFPFPCSFSQSAKKTRIASRRHCQAILFLQRPEITLLAKCILHTRFHNLEGNSSLANTRPPFPTCRNLIHDTRSNQS